MNLGEDIASGRAELRHRVLNSLSDSAAEREGERELDQLLSSLKTLPSAPDLSRSILQGVDAKRPFVPEPVRRRVSSTRVAVGVSIVLVLSVVALLQRFAPETVSATGRRVLVGAVASATRQDISTSSHFMSNMRTLGVELLTPERNPQAGESARYLVTLGGIELGDADFYATRSYEPGGDAIGRMPGASGTKPLQLVCPNQRLAPDAPGSGVLAPDVCVQTGTLWMHAYRPVVLFWPTPQRAGQDTCAAVNIDPEKAEIPSLPASFRQNPSER